MSSEVDVVAFATSRRVHEERRLRPANATWDEMALPGARRRLARQTAKRPARLSLALRAQPMLPSERPLVVLAVLDDGERAALLKMSLAGRGWDVVRAHTCEQARRRAREQPIDALLTDLVLVDGSAFGLLRAMPSRPRVAVVLTWGNQHGIRERIFASGFDLHLSRPITGEEIDRAMRDKLRQTA